MALIGKIISSGETGVDRGALEAALDLGFPYGGYISMRRCSEDGIVPLEFAAMTEDSQDDNQHREELNVINSDATLILLRTPGQTDDAKRTVELCEKYGKPYWIDNPEQPGEWAQGLKLLFWIEETFGERGIVLNVAGPSESKDVGIQATTHLFAKRFLSEYGVNDPLPEVKIISKSPFVKESDGEGIFWSIKTVDPISNRKFDTAISPRALLKSLCENHGFEELLTCTCGIAECKGIRYERFERTDNYIRWSFNDNGKTYTLYFDRSTYETGAIEMLHDVYFTKEGWYFVYSEYDSYDDFKSAVDKFLATKPHFKSIWDEVKVESVKDLPGKAKLSGQQR